MRQELSKLLENHQISHPSRIIEVNYSKNRTLTLSIQGWPWWKKDRTITEAKLFLTFEKVEGGSFDLDLIDELSDKALYNFELGLAEEYDWCSEYGFQIFCSSPIPAPFEIYKLVHDYLVSNNASFGVTDYLNTGSGEYLHGFSKVVTSPTYKLADAPKILSDKICDILIKQKVTFNKIPTRIRSVGKYVVHLGDCSFFCASAYAEYDH